MLAAINLPNADAPYVAGAKGAPYDWKCHFPDGSVFMAAEANLRECGLGADLMSALKNIALGHLNSILFIMFQTTLASVMHQHSNATQQLQAAIQQRDADLQLGKQREAQLQLNVNKLTVELAAERAGREAGKEKCAGLKSKMKNVSRQFKTWAEKKSVRFNKPLPVPAGKDAVASRFYRGLGCARTS